MTTELLLDTENIFRGHRPTPSAHNDEKLRKEINEKSSKTFESLYGTYSPHDHAERLLTIMYAIDYWFSHTAGHRLELVRSYGKRDDPGVRVFDAAVKLDPGYFHYDGIGANADQTIGPDFVRVLHFTVGFGHDEAELRLLKHFAAAVERNPSGTFALGSSDSRTAQAGYHDLQVKFPRLELWVILHPLHVRQHLTFGDGAQYPAIPRERVAHLPAIAKQYRNHLRNQRTSERRKRKARETALQAAIDSELMAMLATPAVTVPDHVEFGRDTVSIDEAFESIRSMNWNVLLHTPLDDWASWSDALGADWARHSITRWIERLCLSDELVRRLRAGELAADVVRRQIGLAFLMSMRNDPARRLDVEAALRLGNAHVVGSPLRFVFEALPTVLLNEDKIREAEAPE